MELRLLKKSMWDDRRADVFVISANGSVTTANNSSSHLSMSQGVALEAARQFPWLPVAASSVIGDSVIGYRSLKAIYGFVCLDNPEDDSHMKRIGLFQSKFGWMEPANVALIGFSAMQLMVWLDNNPRVRRVAMNFPGLGLIGGLTEEQVLPVLEAALDSRVTLYVGPVLGE